MPMPRWDHIWFLLYLLPYGLVFALAWKLKLRLPKLPVWLLLSLPALWLVLTGFLIERVWPRTDTVFNDWGAHLEWAGLFATGVMLAPRSDAWRWMQDTGAASLPLRASWGCACWRTMRCTFAAC
jgi:hypothetical protein